MSGRPLTPTSVFLISDRSEGDDSQSRNHPEAAQIGGCDAVAKLQRRDADRPAFLTRRVNKFVAPASRPAVAWVSRPTPDTVWQGYVSSEFLMRAKSERLAPQQELLADNYLSSSHNKGSREFQSRLFAAVGRPQWLDP